MPQYEMGLRDYWHILQKRKAVVILSCVGIAALTLVLTQYVFRQPASFSAAAEVSVQPSFGDIIPFGPPAPAPSIAQQAKVARSEMLLKQVLRAIEIFPFQQTIPEPIDKADLDQCLWQALASPGTQVAATRQLAHLFKDTGTPEVARILAADRSQKDVRTRPGTPDQQIAECRSKGYFLHAAQQAGPGGQQEDGREEQQRTEDAVIAQLQSRLIVLWDAPTSTFKITVETTAPGLTETDEAPARASAAAIAETIAIVYKARTEWEGRSVISAHIRNITAEIDALQAKRQELADKRVKTQQTLETALADQEYNAAQQELRTAGERLRLLEAYLKQLQDYCTTRLKEADAMPEAPQARSPIPAPPASIQDVNIQALYSFSLAIEQEKNDKLEFYKPESHVILALENKITHTAEQLLDVVRSSVVNETLHREAAERRVDDATRENQIPRLSAEIKELDRELNDNASYIGDRDKRKSDLVLSENRGVKVALIARPAGADRIGAAGAVAKTIVGGLIGLILGIVAAVLWETLDLTIGTIDEVESYLQTRVLGVIPHIDTERIAANIRQRDPHTETEPPDADLLQRALLVTLYDHASIPAESFRHIRTALDLTRTQRKSEAKIILVTSATLNEGKTAVAANLAVVMAQNGKRTCLLECDFRRPQLHRIFGVDRQPGLHDIFIGKASWQEARKSLSDLLLGKIGMDTAVTTPGLENLSLITCGAVPPNPVELLDSAETRRLFEQLRQAFDVVIVDSPPMLAVADAAVISPYVDGAILVYRAGTAPRTILSRAKTELQSVGTELFGVVLNDLKPAAGDISATYPYKGYARKAYDRHEDHTGYLTLRVAQPETVEPAADRSSESTEDQLARKIDLLLLQGKVQQALEAAHAAVRSMPESLSARLELARTYAAANRVGEAQAELLHVLDLDPRNLHALERLASLAVDAGLEREALRWYEEILEFDHQNLKARQRADEIRGQVGNAESHTV